MIFDSEEQKAMLMELLANVQVTMSLKEHVEGAPPLRKLWAAVHGAQVVDVDDQTVLMMKLVEDAD